ncbi:hypothetical protein EN859_028630 [Mesorhizobium sp. M00.F.Ca.ET.216.01.1.1]|nr:hypothetical protein EN859_028630 [Mesorhizobium sp. M00.F.Ca.ET.216.01.1.1]
MRRYQQSLLHSIQSVSGFGRSEENARWRFWNGALPPICHRVVAAEQRGAKINKKLEMDWLQQGNCDDRPKHYDQSSARRRVRCQLNCVSEKPAAGRYIEPIKISAISVQHLSKCGVEKRVSTLPTSWCFSLSLARASLLTFED